MRALLDVAIALAMLVLLVDEPASARTATPKVYVPDAAKNLEGGRKVLLVLPTEIIAPDFPSATGPGSYAGGADIIVLPPYKSPAQFNAEVAVASTLVYPIRAVLAVDDFNDRVRGRLEEIVRQSSWLGAKDVQTTTVNRGYELEQHLNAADTRQMLVLRAVHLVGFNCDTLIVRLEAMMLVRQIPRGKTHDIRLTKDYIPYQLAFVANFHLPDVGKITPEQNVARWHADRGRLARLAMDRGIEWVTTRFAQTLSESDAQSQAWRERGDRHLQMHSDGWILEQGPEGKVAYYPGGRALILDVNVGS